MLYQILALLASFAWSLGALFSFQPAFLWGSLRFNFLRILFTALAMILGYLLFQKEFWPEVMNSAWFWVAASSFSGLILGDGCLFITMRLIGPRRTTLLFSTNSPLALVCSIFIFNTQYTFFQIFGILLSFLGVILAVVPRRAAFVHHIEPQYDPIFLPIGSGFLAALGQALGVMSMRKAIMLGADSLTVNMWRLVVAGVFFFFLVWAASYFFRKEEGKQKLLFPPFQKNKKAYFYLIFNAILGLGIGSTLVSFALIEGNPGLVATLSSLSPVLVLPMLWVITKQAPKPLAWFGAFLTMVGIGCIFLG